MSSWRSGPPHIIYCGGVFDLFHAGHVQFFKRCSVYGRVVACVNTNEFVARYKRPPIMTLDERVAVVKGCRFVTDVIVNWGEEDASESILKSGATRIAHGSDWTNEQLMEHYGITQDWLDEHEIGMLSVPYSYGVSTTDLIERCRRLAPPERKS